MLLTNLSPVSGERYFFIIDLWPEQRWSHRDVLAVAEWAVLAQHQGLLCSSPCPASEQAGGARGAGRGHSQTPLTKGYPRSYGTTLSNKSRGRRRTGTFGAMALCLAPSSWGVMEPCCPGGGGAPACDGKYGKERRDSSFCFACTHSLCFTC